MARPVRRGQGHVPRGICTFVAESLLTNVLWTLQFAFYIGIRTQKVNPLSIADTVDIEDQSDDDSDVRENSIQQMMALRRKRFVEAVAQEKEEREDRLEAFLCDPGHSIQTFFTTYFFETGMYW